MSAMDVKARDALAAMDRLRAHPLGRRGFVGGVGAGAAALGLGLRGTHAQDASPAAPVEPVRSVPREEYASALFETFPMSEPEQTGGQVIVGVGQQDISTVNGILADDAYSFYIVGQVFESLVGTSVIDGTIVPGLADSYESEDGLTYTFHLNPTVTWHDGTPFTAADVEFSFDAVLDPDSSSSYASSVASNLVSYRAVDDHTFEIVAAFPSSSFFYDVAGTVVIIPKHIWENVPLLDWPADPGSTGQDPSRVVGTGAFMFKEWVPNDHATIVPNPNYWDTVTGRVPVIDEWIYRVLPDDNAAVQALITGESDILDTIPAPQTEDVINTPGRRVEIFDTFSFTFYYYNLSPERTALFQEVEVRQALFTSIDKQGIVDTVYAGYGQVAVGTQATLSFAYAPDQMRNRWDYDPARAMQLLDDAGWVAGDDGVRTKDGNRLAFTLLLPEGSTGDLLAAVFQENWDAIGAEVEIEIIPFDVLLTRLDAFDFDAVLLGFSWTPDPGQGPMFRCDAIPPNGFNSAQYCNPQYDELDTAQAAELNPERRREILIELSNIINDDLPVGIFRFAQDRTGIHERVQNYYVNDYSFYWSFPFVWLQS